MKKLLLIPILLLVIVTFALSAQEYTEDKIDFGYFASTFGDQYNTPEFRAAFLKVINGSFSWGLVENGYDGIFGQEDLYTLSKEEAMVVKALGVGWFSMLTITDNGRYGCSKFFKDNIDDGLKEVKLKLKYGDI